ncbi:response regulator transcription factor [Variovorax rhizosphaerae]|uniref:Response regulator n=1 Tax=Variovorax rhizosphaerae TaxID=1836200 RepID=A0ABU8WFT4_9BURK
MKKNHCVHVVDDDDDMREALVSLLQALGHDATGHRSAGEFLFSAWQSLPGCLLLDVDMPGQSGLDLQRMLNERDLRIPIIFLSGKADVPMCARALKAGAVDFLTKPFRREEVEAALSAAFAMVDRRQAVEEESESLRHRFHTLTQREQSVAKQIVQGRLNKQIAADFGVSERTVKSYRAQVMEKMNVQSVPQLVEALLGLPRTQPAPLTGTSRPAPEEPGRMAPAQAPPDQKAMQ